jgi:hypothetical protein
MCAVLLMQNLLSKASSAPHLHDRYFRTVLQAMSKLEAILIDIDRDSKESLISGSSIESAQHNARRARRQAFADAGSDTIAVSSCTFVKAPYYYFTTSERMI